MTRFVVGDDRYQSTLFPERLDDYLGEDNPVRAIPNTSLSRVKCADPTSGRFGLNPTIVRVNHSGRRLTA
jgi:hypothetical protein